MLAELTPEQLVEWEAALTVLELDVNKWAAAKVCEVLHEVAERFASYETTAETMQAMKNLPKAEDFMGLLKFDDQPERLGIPVQSQASISRTLQNWAR